MATAKSMPPAFKGAKKFVECAEDMDVAAQRFGGNYEAAAYFCRKHAASQCIALMRAAPADEQAPLMAWLGPLMDQLESGRKSLGESMPGLLADEPRCAEVMGNLALMVFKRCDDEDRAGNATMSTARTFVKAATYIEVASSFDKDNADLEEKRVYAKGKALQIVKAIKSGQKPTPGPVGGPADPTLEADASAAPAPSAAAGGVDSLPSAPSDPAGLPSAPSSLPSAPANIPSSPAAPTGGYGGSSGGGYASMGPAAPAPNAPTVAAGVRMDQSGLPALPKEATAAGSRPRNLSGLRPEINDAVMHLAHVIRALQENNLDSARDHLRPVVRTLGM